MARPAVLVIAATDSSGGAGLTRDVRVLSDFSVDALCVVTAVTAQSDKKVTAVHHIPPDVIRAQIDAALATRQVGAIKIGMLGNRATVEAVVEGLKANRSARGWPGPGESVASGSPPLGLSFREGWSHGIPVVVDPVLVSTSGGVLLDAGGRAALTEALFPLATLVTPNVPEASALLGEALATGEAELVEQGFRLLGFGSGAILLKGGHRYADDRTAERVNAGRGSAGRGNAERGNAQRGDVERGDANHTDTEDAVDLLVLRDGTADGRCLVERIVSKRVVGTSRGTGCALASAIAAGLAAGKPLNEACRAAKNYVLGMLTPVS